MGPTTAHIESSSAVPKEPSPPGPLSQPARTPARERGRFVPATPGCANQRGADGGALSRREGVKGWERVGVRVLVPYLLAVRFFAAPATAADCTVDRERVVQGELGAKLDLYLDRVSAFGYSGAVAVASGDEIVLLSGYGEADHESGRPFTAATAFTLASLTKQLTAAAILALEADGELSAEDPIGRFFENVPEDKASITLHQLLTHTSGLGSSFFRDHDEVSREQLLAAAFSSDLVSTPGETWQYSNAGYSVLAAVVEVVTGRPYEGFLLDRILGPAEIKASGYTVPSWDPTCVSRGYRRGEDQGPPPGIDLRPDAWALIGNGGLTSTAADVLRWHRALRDEKVLGPAAKDKLFAPHVTQPTSYGDHYGYGWFVDEAGERVLHGGSNAVYSADLVRDLGRDALVFVASNIAEFPAAGIRRKLEAIASGKDPGLPLPPVAALPEDELQGLAGTCELASGGRLTVAVDGAEVIVSGEGQDALDPLFSAPVDQRRRLAERAGRTAALVAAAVGGDPRDFLEAFGPRPESVRDSLKKAWDDLRAEHGAYRSVDEIGAWAEGGFDRVAVRVLFENGEDRQMYLWAGDRLAGVSRLQQLPRRVFLPLSSDELAALDPRSLQVTRLRFLMSAGAEKLEFVTAEGSVEVRCRKKIRARRAQDGSHGFQAVDFRFRSASIR